MRKIKALIKMKNNLIKKIAIDKMMKISFMNIPKK